MAAMSTKVQSSLAIKFKTGVDAKTGKDVVKSAKFSNVKVSATDDSIFAVGQAIGSLLNHSLVSIMRDDQSEIANQ